MQKTKMKPPAKNLMLSYTWPIVRKIGLGTLGTNLLGDSRSNFKRLYISIYKVIYKYIRLHSEVKCWCFFTSIKGCLIGSLQKYSMIVFWKGLCCGLWLFAGGLWLFTGDLWLSVDCLWLFAGGLWLSVLDCSGFLLLPVLVTMSKLLKERIWVIAPVDICRICWQYH